MSKAGANSFSSATSKWEHEDLAKVKICVFRGHTEGVQSCTFCANDRKILTASSDCSVLLWNAQTGEPIHRYVGGHSRYISKAAANADATRFVSTGWDRKVLLWDTESSQILWHGSHDGIVTSCNFSHDGSLVVTCSDLDLTVRIWNSNDGSLVKEIKDQHSSTITSCCFSPKDDRIFTTSMDGTSKVFDLNSSKNTICLSGHRNVVSSCSCTTDERRFATVSWDKSIRVSDISTGDYRLQGCSTIEKAHEGSISSCDFSKDGRFLVTGGYDKQIYLWDIDNMVLKLKLQGHGDWVNDVNFSENQKWVLSASKDGTVRMWNIETIDNIPIVIETKKSTGLQLFECSLCGTIFRASENIEEKVCVFCRLEKSNKEQ